MTDPQIRAMFDPAPGSAYLDAATYGLPPRPAVEALERAVEGWRTGTARWVEDWDRPAEAARDGFADLIGATAADIALIPTASVGTGLVAAALRPGDVVVVPADEHASDLFPLLLAERRGIVVQQVAFDDVAASIGPDTSLVVTSVVQMQTGRVADLVSIGAAVRAHGARLLLDATHAIPFVPIDVRTTPVDYLVCHAYKHLLGARGSAFLYVRHERLDDLQPSHANWRGAADPWSTFFGGPLTLAEDASRFNVSLAWLPWVATLASLPLIARWRAAGALTDALDLASRLAEACGVPSAGSSLVCVGVTDATAARAALEAAGIRAAVRGEGIRFSLHVWNDESDVDRAAAAIRPFLGARTGR